ncbi:MAG TPA: ABC transporter permease [Trebonia sp.]|jgi:peptide/nickel transport system permease protein|nr:ABC transporter permease [Trebonia sp.]
MLKTILLRRVVGGVFILWLVSVLVFAAIHLLPGSAVTILTGHQETTPGEIASLTQQLGLNQPLAVQYGHWLKGLVTGNWGTSLVSSVPVSQIVGTKVVNTGILTLISMLILAPVAVVVGAVSAIRRNRLIDHVTSVVTLCLGAVPAFAIGIVVIYVLATNVFHWLPAASILNPEQSVWIQLNLVLLPAITVALAMLPYPIRMVRATMIEVLESDYVMLARLKGVPERQVIFRHAMRNGIGPIIQALALTLLFLSGGIIIVETVFSYPGVGYALVQGVAQRDVPVVQTIVVVLATIAVTINLLADLAVAFATPRLRTALT